MAKSASKPARTVEKVVISYPQLFTARAAFPGQTPKFGVVLMFDKNNADHKKALNDLHRDLKECLAEQWPDESKRPRPELIGGPKSPIKDGDTTLDSNGLPIGEKNSEYKGHYIIRANTSRQPIVCDKNKATIMDTNEMYGGCICNVNINAYAFVVRSQTGTVTSQGVTFGLNGVQKWADGEAFGGGRPDMDAMFEGGGDSGQDDPANYPSGSDDPFGGQPPAPATTAGANDDSPF